MSIIAIARIVQYDCSKNVSDMENVIGFRLLDTDTKNIKDCNIKGMADILINKKSTIDNLDVQLGKVVGSNGAISRLPKIINGQLVGKSPLIIINQIDDHKYTAANYMGQVIEISESGAIEYAKQQGIANGKLSVREGKEFISCITGEYKKINKTKTAGKQPVYGVIKCIHVRASEHDEETKYTIEMTFSDIDAFNRVLRTFGSDFIDDEIGRHIRVSGTVSVTLVFSSNQKYALDHFLKVPMYLNKEISYININDYEESYNFHTQLSGPDFKPNRNDYWVGSCANGETLERAIKRLKESYKYAGVRP